MNIRLSIQGACAFSLLTTLTGAALSSVTESQFDSPRWSQQTCPLITVSCPSSFKPGEVIIFQADIVGGNPNVVPQYNWTISAGRIIEGQGTSSIKVDTAGFGRAFTATVRVAGFENSCPVTASCSNMIGHNAPPAVLFDRYYPKSTGPAVPKKPHTRGRVRRRH
jgi:hypothetical protein